MPPPGLGNRTTILGGAHEQRPEESDAPQVDARHRALRTRYHGSDCVRSDRLCLAGRGGRGFLGAWSGDALPGRQISFVIRANRPLPTAAAPMLITGPRPSALWVSAHFSSGTPGPPSAGATGSPVLCSSPVRAFFWGTDFLVLSIAPITIASGTAAKTAYFTFVVGGKGMSFGTTQASCEWSIGFPMRISFMSYSNCLPQSRQTT